MLLWMGMGLIVMGIGAVMFFSWFRKRYRSPGAEESGRAFTVEDAQRLYQAGTISKEEFSRLRRIALGLPAVAQKPDQADGGQAELNDGPRLDDKQAGDQGGEGNLRREQE